MFFPPCETIYMLCFPHICESFAYYFVFITIIIIILIHQKKYIIIFFGITSQKGIELLAVLRKWYGTIKRLKLVYLSFQMSHLRVVN